MYKFWKMILEDLQKKNLTNVYLNSKDQTDTLTLWDVPIQIYIYMYSLYINIIFVAKISTYTVVKIIIRKKAMCHIIIYDYNIFKVLKVV